MKKMAFVLALAAGAGFGITAVNKPALADNHTVAQTGGLQLSITSASTENGNYVPVTVHFHHGNIGFIKLFIDGAMVSHKPLYTRSGDGEIEFKVPVSLLPPGVHLITVEASDLQGNSSAAHLSVRSSQPAPAGPVAMVYPQANATVQGVVPLQVKVDPTISQPFVSFFIDNHFLELSNYAPFTFNWNSAHISNGPHTITVEVIDGATQVRVQTLHIPILVNNPGGFTVRQTLTPQHANIHSPALLSPVTALKSHVEGALSAPETPAIAAPSLLSPATVSPVAQTAPARFSSHTLAPALASAQHALSSVPSYAPVMQTPQPHMAGILANPAPAFRFNRPATRLAAPTLFAPIRSGNFAAVPPAFAVASSGFRSKTETARVEPLIVGHGPLTNGAKSIQVAFNNTRIVFDVPPRVLNGIPIAPFRQIFEHTGGQIHWYNHSKTVRAINSTSEIIFRIGHKHATINNKKVDIQVTPFLDHGRSMVPISFVKEALNVKVHFNARTGHLRIESK